MTTLINKLKDKIGQIISGKPPYGYSGNFSSWREARALTSGYDSDVIINKVRQSALKVKKAEAVYERDSVIFDTIQMSWPVLAGLLWVASLRDNEMVVLDYGGSLGTSYFQNISFLKHLKKLEWHIIEQPKLSEIGKKNSRMIIFAFGRTAIWRQ